VPARLLPATTERLVDVEAIDTVEVHVRPDSGDLTRVPTEQFVTGRWTTVESE